MRPVKKQFYRKMDSIFKPTSSHC